MEYLVFIFRTWQPHPIVNIGRDVVWWNETKDGGAIGKMTATLQILNCQQGLGTFGNSENLRFPINCLNFLPFPFSWAFGWNAAELFGCYLLGETLTAIVWSQLLIDYLHLWSIYHLEDMEFPASSRAPLFHVVERPQDISKSFVPEFEICWQTELGWRVFNRWEWMSINKI